MEYTGSESICTKNLGRSQNNILESEKRCSIKAIHLGRYNRKMTKINKRIYAWQGRGNGFVQIYHKGKRVRNPLAKQLQVGN